MHVSFSVIIPWCMGAGVIIPGCASAALVIILEGWVKGVDCAWIEEVSNAGVPTADEAFERQIRRHQMAALKKSLLVKQNSVGVKHKVPWSLTVQRIPLEYPDPNYTVWWYALPRMAW